MKLNNPTQPERRQSPRYAIRQSADMVLADGNIYTVNTRNISKCGLQIACDAWVTREIDPRGIQSHTISHLRFKIIMELKLKDEIKKLYVNCRIMSVQRLSQDEYMLSLAFTEFENGSENTLEKFINQFQQTNVIHKGVVGE